MQPELGSAPDLANIRAVFRFITPHSIHAALREAELEDFRFHDLRHTWASWHRQADTSRDELRELGGWKSRVMVDRYAKYATEHLAITAARIESERGDNVIRMSRFPHSQKKSA